MGKGYIIKFTHHSVFISLYDIYETNLNKNILRLKMNRNN